MSPRGIFPNGNPGTQTYRKKIRGASLTDQMLMDRFHGGGEGRRRYMVLYDKDPDPFEILADSADEARVYAREYGYRFLDAAVIVDLRWVR